MGFEKGEKPPVFKKTVEVDGSNVNITRAHDGIGIEVFSGDTETVAKKIAEAFGGTAEQFDHPGASHIYVIKLEGRDKDVDTFIKEMKEKGLLSANGNNDT